MKLPASLQNLINFFEQLPGIGPKSAARLVFYLWQTPDSFVSRFAQALLDLKAKTKQCSVCFNLDETNPCSVCSDKKRQQSLVCVVERPLDVLALERMGGFAGVYHVLGGVINPLEHVGPEELTIRQLLNRVKNGQITELVLATNPTMEGEATALYIARQVNEKSSAVKVTRLGRGLPTGADLDYADSWTLKQAWENRKELGA
ncbi:MAG: recombination mediator RecR [Patescibacteria group bacterium]